MTRFRWDERAFLVLAALVTVGLWQVSWGQMVLYPFTLFATYAHEAGHGMTALVLGGSFEGLTLYPDGSGVAAWRGDFGPVGRAAVAAGGLVGPACFGAGLFAASRNIPARYILVALTVFTALVMVFFAESGFTVVALGVLATVLFTVARWAPRTGAPFLLQLLALQLALSVFRDLDYMFSPGGEVGGELVRSDTGAIEDALLLPYWFWGTVTATFAFTVVLVGFARMVLPKQKARDGALIREGGFG